MRPTLYADTLLVNAEEHNGMLLFDNDAADALIAILPLRCPCDTQPTSIKPPVDCDGLGFLYPDPPDWWTAGWVDEIAADMERRNPGTMKAEWEVHLRQTYRAMGILEEDR